MHKFGLPGLAIICLAALPQALAAAIWTNTDPGARSATVDSAWFRADDAALRARLADAPHEVLLDRSLTIELPMPDGGLRRFSIVESPILQGGFPGVKTFKLHGIDDRGASGRADITHRGFSAMLRTSRGLVFIDPEPGPDRLYHSFYRRGAGSQPFACGVHARNENPLAHVQPPRRPSNRLAGNYQTYRIAVSATSEYVAAAGSEAAARSAIITTINRVNQIYETDLGIRLLLVGNNGGLLEDDSDGCFSNDDAIAMLLENQVWIDERIGSAGYDIGHVFSTFNGGVAFLGSACQDVAKAGGVSGLSNPTGDPFSVDIVAHEIGHQLNADHSFNGTTLSCGGGNRNGATAWEPGSGSTVMAYAGICGLSPPLDTGENLQQNSDAMFHAGSMGQIDTFTASGGSCRGLTANGNNDPTLTPLADRFIPARTPFRLEVAAADVDPDTLVYQWDQVDVGTFTDNTSFGTDLGSNALFRSYPAQTDAWRDFPALGTQVQGLTDEAEVLPTTARALDFRVTVLDGNSGQVSDDFRLTTVAGTGFRVTSDGSAGGTLDTTVTPYTIEWDTANSENAPVSCANVNIDLLTFNNVTYDRYSIHPIAANTPNDGIEAVATPLASSHPRARIRVMCSDNVFYAISNSDLNVIGTAGTFSDTDFATFFNNKGVTLSRPGPGAAVKTAQSGGQRIDLFASAGTTSAARIEECTADSGRRPNGDATAVGPWWLMAMAALLFPAIRRRVTVCSES